MITSIAIYGSHDSNIAIRVGPDEYRSYELERLTGKRHYSLHLDPEAKEVLIKMRDYLFEWHKINQFDCIYYSECDERLRQIIQDVFAPRSMQWMPHHDGHAACAFWQSSFKESLIVSFDGGGNDREGVTCFNIYLANRHGNSLKKIATLPLDICSAYTMIAWPLEAIKKTGWDSYLSWAGKKMGLVAYGKVRDNWYSHFENFYYGNVGHDELSELIQEIDTESNGDMNTITGFYQCAMIAATSQKVFEDIFLRAIKPFLHRYNLPVCLTGGGALNVLLNQRLHDILKSDFNGRQIFVPCNPNDAGLALGFILQVYPPDSGEMKEIMYGGFPILDQIDWSFADRHFKYQEYSPKELAKYLVVHEKIVGIAQGNSEVGPRALGNRSIICYPKSKEIKDKVNNTIKFREDFRPFAPLIREQDASYFFPDGPFESKYMTYSQKANSVFCIKYPAVAHYDKTARVQTIGYQNEFLYNVLCEMKDFIFHTDPVLMNTSFNSNGKPILTTCKEAFDVLLNTELDAVWINGILFEKKMRSLYLPNEEIVTLSTPEVAEADPSGRKARKRSS